MPLRCGAVRWYCSTRGRFHRARSDQRRTAARRRRWGRAVSSCAAILAFAPVDPSHSALLGLMRGKHTTGLSGRSRHFSPQPCPGSQTQPRYAGWRRFPAHAAVQWPCASGAREQTPHPHDLRAVGTLQYSGHLKTRHLPVPPPHPVAAARPSPRLWLTYQAVRTAAPWDHTLRARAEPREVRETQYR